MLRSMETAQRPWKPRQSAPLQGTASAANAIARVRYSHDGMIDLILSNPALSQGDIARHFGFTEAWVSRVMNSDAFQARLAARKSDIIDPSLTLTIQEKIAALASKSLDRLIERVSTASTGDLELRALEITSKALGYGARQTNLNVQQNFVVAMPAKAESENDWAAKHALPVMDVQAKPVA